MTREELIKEVQFGNGVLFRDNDLWVSYRGQLVGMSDAGLISSVNDNHVRNNLKGLNSARPVCN